MLCPKVSWQEEMESRKEKGMRSHSLHGPGVDIVVFAHPDSFPFSILWFGWGSSYASHPQSDPIPTIGMARPSLAKQCTPSIGHGIGSGK